MKHDLILQAQAVELSGNTVERDAEGLPVAWRLLKPGPLRYHHEGVWSEVMVTPAHIEQALALYAETGSRPIPVDCEHALHRLAPALVEADVARSLETVLGADPAAGYVHLERRGSELWAKVERWTAGGKALLLSAGYRWFSPVIRGILGGKRVWLSSVTLTNVPAQPDIEALVASAIGGGAQPPETETREPEAVQKLLLLMAKLLGRDALALSAEGAPSETDLAELDKAVKTAQTNGELVAAVREALALDAITPDTVRGKLTALAAGAAQTEALSAKVATLETAALDRERADLVASGVASGKLTPKLQEWAKTQSPETLRAFLASAPALVLDGKAIDLARLGQPETTPNESLSKVARACGVDPAAALKYLPKEQ